MKNLSNKICKNLFHLIKKINLRQLIRKSKDVTFPSQADTLASIDLNYLNAFEIRGIILDLDNTIISEDDQYLSPYAENWIEKAKQLDLKLFFCLMVRGDIELNIGLVV